MRTRLVPPVEFPHTTTQHTHHLRIYGRNGFRALPFYDLKGMTPTLRCHKAYADIDPVGLVWYSKHRNGEVTLSAYDREALDFASAQVQSAADHCEERRQGIVRFSELQEGERFEWHGEQYVKYSRAGAVNGLPISYNAEVKHFQNNEKVKKL